MIWTCERCGVTVNVPDGVRAVCSCPSKPKRRIGVGTEFSKLLKRLGIYPKKGCGCAKHAATMDGNGIEWCEANTDTIVEWVREEAVRREMLFSETGVRALLWVAIRKAKLARYFNERKR